MQQEERLNKAISFAALAHAGQKRKGSGEPYILHPLEVGQILHRLHPCEELIIAGYLHDVVEDTNATLDDIEQMFGYDVACLVNNVSENKKLSWRERKEIKIEHTRKALAINDLVGYLKYADSLSNLRSCWIDFVTHGESFWDSFNAPYEEQKWYYGEMYQVFKKWAIEYFNKEGRFPIYFEEYESKLKTLFPECFSLGEFVKKVEKETPLMPPPKTSCDCYLDGPNRMCRDC